MNPCPCGYAGDESGKCSCTQQQIAAYQKRISGPLLDRIDLHVGVTKIPHEHFFRSDTLKNTQHLSAVKLIKRARLAQKKRYNCSDSYNAYASIQDAKRLFFVQPTAQKLLQTASTTLDLSSRSALRVLRVARTIADLDNSLELKVEHVAEAIQFRGSWNL